MRINWKKRIQKDGTIDMQGLNRHELKFSQKSRVVKVYGFDVVMPEEAPDEDCVNYGLSTEDQIFRKTYLPNQIKYPTKNFGVENFTQKQQDEFIDHHWFLRINGYWIFIKGNKYYIPGNFWWFLNFWKSQTGEELIYRFTGLELAWIWMYACHHPRIYGIADFKCRQIGDTEFGIGAILYEFTTRVRGVKSCMQSLNLEHIEGIYDRVLYGHKHMIYYFKPINQGSDDPRNGLHFNYPSETVNFEKIKRQTKEYGTATQTNLDYEYPEINSQVLYGPAKAKFFDGGTYGRAFNDEFGKNETMDPNDWLKVIIEAMRSRIKDKKMGMIFMPSTVEEMKSGETLKNALRIYKQSDPTPLKDGGETVNGLINIFRGALDRAPVDYWGFPKKDEELIKINQKVKSLMQMGDIRGMIDYKRKNCVTIEDVFKSTNDESQFDIESLQERLFFLENVSEKKLYVKGNLKWKDGVRDTTVIFEPNKKGKWVISKHPKDFGLESNAKVSSVFSPKPGNVNYFKMGLDPYDQQTTLESDPSLGGIAVKRVLDEYIDSGKDLYYQFEDREKGIQVGDPVDKGANFKTNRYVCTYLHREQDPNDFFEDVILTMVYYGTDFLPEKDKFGACHSYIKTRGYGLYLMEKPTTAKNSKGQVEREGVSATTGNIDTYFSFLTTLSCKWANTIDHPDLLEQLLEMNWANRGKKDLAVAAGWCEFAASQPRSRFKPQEQQKIVHWQENYV